MKDGTIITETSLEPTPNLLDLPKTVIVHEILRKLDIKALLYFGATSKKSQNLVFTAIIIEYINFLKKNDYEITSREKDYWLSQPYTKNRKRLEFLKDCLSDDTHNNETKKNSYALQIEADTKTLFNLFLQALSDFKKKNAIDAIPISDFIRILQEALGEYAGLILIYFKFLKIHYSNVGPSSQIVSKFKNLFSYLRVFLAVANIILRDTRYCTVEDYQLTLTNYDDSNILKYQKFLFANLVAYLTNKIVETENEHIYKETRDLIVYYLKNNKLGFNLEIINHPILKKNYTLKVMLDKEFQGTLLKLIKISPQKLLSLIQNFSIEVVGAFSAEQLELLTIGQLKVIASIEGYDNWLDFAYFVNPKHYITYDDKGEKIKCADLQQVLLKIEERLPYGKNSGDLFERLKQLPDSLQLIILNGGNLSNWNIEDLCAEEYQGYHRYIDMFFGFLDKKFIDSIIGIVDRNIREKIIFQFEHNTSGDGQFDVSLISHLISKLYAVYGEESYLKQLVLIIQSEELNKLYLEDYDAESDRCFITAISYAKYLFLKEHTGIDILEAIKDKDRNAVEQIISFINQTNPEYLLLLVKNEEFDLARIELEKREEIFKLFKKAVFKSFPKINPGENSFFSPSDSDKTEKQQVFNNN